MFYLFKLVTEHRLCVEFDRACAEGDAQGEEDPWIYRQVHQWREENIPPARELGLRAARPEALAPRSSLDTLQVQSQMHERAVRPPGCGWKA